MAIKYPLGERCVAVMEKKTNSPSHSEIESLLQEMAGFEAERKKSFNQPLFALGAITGGLGVSEMTVRNWLTRGQIVLSENREPGESKHRRFSKKDAIKIAAAYQLSSLGAPIQFRIDLAERVADYAEGLCTRIQGTPRNPVLLIFNDGEWKCRHTYDDGPLRLTGNDGVPAVFTVLDVKKLIFDALRPLGVDMVSGTADDLKERVASGEGE